MKQLKPHGFTIIELLIATTIFSVVLLLAASGLLYIGRLYYKGLTSSATQEAARNIMQELTQRRVLYTLDTFRW